MKNIEIGAFEAKTHFSQLLKEVENGTVVHISRRGQPVAVLLPEGQQQQAAAKNALERIKDRKISMGKKTSITIEDIFRFRDEGRK